MQLSTPILVERREPHRTLAVVVVLGIDLESIVELDCRQHNQDFDHTNLDRTVVAVETPLDFEIRAVAGTSAAVHNQLVGVLHTL